MTTLKSYKCDNCKVHSQASEGVHGPNGWAAFLVQVISSGPFAPIGNICPPASQIHICDNCVITMRGSLLRAMIQVAQTSPNKRSVFGNRPPMECTDERPKEPK